MWKILRSLKWRRLGNVCSMKEVGKCLNKVAGTTVNWSGNNQTCLYHLLTDSERGNRRDCGGISKSLEWVLRTGKSQCNSCLSREQGKGKEDYRPVSLTSVGNIFESIINDDVLGYMEVNDKIGQSQWRDVAWLICWHLCISGCLLGFSHGLWYGAVYEAAKQDGSPRY